MSCGMTKISLLLSLEINPAISEAKDAYDNVEKWAKTEKACVSNTLDTLNYHTEFSAYDGVVGIRLGLQ